jgi:F-type H+-transporting ATPase subunit b
LAWLAVPALVLGLTGVAWASGGADMTGDLLKRVMNFVALAIALVFLLRKPLKKFFADRTQGITDELAELEAKREAAKADLAKIEATLKAAEADKEAILAEYRAQGEKEQAKIIASAHITAERVKTQAQFTIGQEVAQAKAELKREVAVMSASVAEDLIRQKITAQDQSRLVDEYLSKVQEVQ